MVILTSKYHSIRQGGLYHQLFSAVLYLSMTALIFSASTNVVAQTAPSTIQPITTPATSVAPASLGDAPTTAQPKTSPGTTPPTAQPTTTPAPMSATQPVAQPATQPVRQIVTQPPREQPVPIPLEWFTEWNKRSQKVLRTIPLSIGVTKNVNNIFDVIPIAKQPKLPTTYLKTPDDAEITLALSINKFSTGLPLTPSTPVSTGISENPPAIPAGEAVTAATGNNNSPGPAGAGSACTKSIETVMSCLNVGYLLDVTSNEWILYHQPRSGGPTQIIKAPKDATDDYFQWLRTGLGYNAVALAQQDNYLLVLAPPGATQSELKGKIHLNSRQTFAMNKNRIEIDGQAAIQLVRSEGRLGIFKILPGPQGEIPRIAPLSKILLDPFDIAAPVSAQ